MNWSEKDLGIIIYCCSLLEEKAAEAYNHAAEIIGNKFISCLFRYISRDSLKHAEFLRSMSETLAGNISAHPDECVKICDEAWLAPIKDAERILGKREMSLDDLPPLIRGLESIESFAAEEYLTALYVKLTELMASEEKIDLGYYKKILEWIIEDEEKHRQILKMIERLLAQS
ncbi:MAG: hypothetical protein QXZ64_03235 [Candidatus Bathyarchaeia archaeon]